ncbi:hypothetical protein AWI44_17505, partial [Vibrio cholerae]
ASVGDLVVCMKDEISNPDLGAIYTTKILGVLLENWPKQTYLCCSEVTGIDFDEESVFDSFSPQPYPKEWEVCRDLIVWLENEGFIRSEGSRGSSFGFFSVEITMSAMTALNQVPDPLDPESTRTLKDTLKDIAKSGSGKLADKIMDKAFFAFVTMLEKSAG